MLYLLWLNRIIVIFKNKLTCENNEIDFPNVITYWKEAEVLNASVAGGEFEITFEFEKINVVK